ncbi:cupin domain-containing protein [Sediminitomix flava]|uniref:Cupin 2 domain-containing protein n=1 Tax=Sediminitomix flava TaxID=379075 RepID=A0A315Z9Z8_SEDFL|nr:cupin domain-containing protein [Sediminitomix flava]PWJ42406.1 cupin 2 domain-containing protein [Sediminitomix flava]
MEKKNIYDKIPLSLQEELFTDLFTSDKVRIERIVSDGHESNQEEWYDQKEGEWVILLEGKAGIRKYDGSIIDLKKGDYLFIPAHEKHQVAYTSKEPKAVWLAIFITV